MAFSLAMLVFVLGATEAGLRLSGFRYAPVPVLVDAAWGREPIAGLNLRAQREQYRPDDLLFWSLVPGVRFDVRIANEQGIINDPVIVPKPEGTFRILCLGDSCTALGPAAYPTVLQRQLDTVARPERRFEVIGAGVFSYSSLQGLRLYRDRIGDVQADLVTIYYGWNDGFLAGKCPDKMLRSRNTQASPFLRLLRHLRLYQWVWKGVNAARTKSSVESSERDPMVRVAPDDYRDNLSAIVDLVRARGGKALLITSPSNLRLGHVPSLYVENKQVEDGEALIIRHRRYNEIVRSTAAAKKAHLLDLAATFEAYPKTGLFQDDAIHPNLAGRHLIAELLAGKLVRLGILSAEEEQRIRAETAYDSRVPRRLRSRVAVLGEPLRAIAGRPCEIVARLENTGDSRWLSQTDDGAGNVAVGFRVFERAGQQPTKKGHTSLPHDVPPGGHAQVRWTLEPMDKAGTYSLEIDLVSRNVAWFRHLGDVPTTAELVVESAE